MALRMICYSCGERITPSTTPSYNPAGNTVHAKCLNAHVQTASGINTSFIDFVYGLQSNTQYRFSTVQIPNKGHFYSVPEGHNAFSINLASGNTLSSKVISWEPNTENWELWDCLFQGARLKLNSGSGVEALRQSLNNHGFNV